MLLLIFILFSFLLFMIIIIYILQKLEFELSLNLLERNVDGIDCKYVCVVSHRPRYDAGILHFRWIA
jgi:hypothetical protein